MSDITWLHFHLYVAYGVIAALAGLALLLLVVAVRVSRPHEGRHAREVREDPVWGDLSWHDEAFERALAEDDDPYATAPFAPDLSSDATIRKYQLQAWDSAGFPAIPRTVQTVTLPPLPEVPPNVPGWHGEGRGRYYILADEELVSAADFPDGAGGMPAPAAGVGLAVDAVSAGGEPSTDLPGPVPSVDMTMPRGNANAPAGEPFWRRFLRRPAVLPVAATVPRAPQPPPCAGPDGDGEPDFTWHADDEPVLEGRVVAAPLLGYIDGLALTSTYYERIEQIGVQARVLALAAAA